MWLDDRQMARLEEHSKHLEANFKHWQKEIDGWLKALSSNRTQKREAALEQLRAVRDPGAAQALEIMVSPISMEAAMEVVGVLDKIEGYEASESLARHALAAPWPEVASAAATALKGATETRIRSADARSAPRTNPIQLQNYTPP